VELQLRRLSSDIHMSSADPADLSFSFPLVITTLTVVNLHSALSHFTLVSRSLAKYTNIFGHNVYLSFLRLAPPLSCSSSNNHLRLHQQHSMCCSASDGLLLCLYISNCPSLHNNRLRLPLLEVERCPDVRSFCSFLTITNKILKLLPPMPQRSPLRFSQVLS
jgi:hypothetical protein